MVAALDQYRQALEQDPDNLAARLNQGMALAQVEPPQFQAALRAFQLVLERDVANVEALIGLGHVYNQLGQDVKAVESFTRALKIEPSSAVALKNLANMALKARPPDAERAQQLLEKAVRLDPNSPEIQNDLGVVYWQAGKLDEAKYHLKAAIRLAPDWPLPKRVLAKLEGA